MFLSSMIASISALPVNGRNAKAILSMSLPMIASMVAIYGQAVSSIGVEAASKIANHAHLGAFLRRR